MSLNYTEMVERVQKKLERMKRDRRYKKANAQFQADVDRLAMQADCRGDLRLCMEQMAWIIEEQSINIRKGRKEEMNTVRQEQILWDAALCYLMVKEADYALSSVSDNEAVIYAYNILDEAMKHISGSKSGAKNLLKKKLDDDKLNGKYLTSSQLRSKKESDLEEMREQIILTGDIERVIKSWNAGSYKKTKKSMLDQRMDGIPDYAKSERLSAEELDNLTEVHHYRPTVDKKEKSAEAKSQLQTDKEGS